MTIKVFVEHVQTIEGGDLSKSQVEQKWQEMLDDTIKCAVVVCTDIVDYSNMANRRKVERQMVLGKWGYFVVFCVLERLFFSRVAVASCQADALVQSSNKRIGEAVAAKVGSLSIDDQGTKNCFCAT